MIGDDGMTEKRFIDCLKCKHHNYDSFFGSDDDWEICDKGHEELYPKECGDFDDGSGRV